MSKKNQRQAQNPISSSQPASNTIKIVAPPSNSSPAPKDSTRRQKDPQQPKGSNHKGRQKKESAAAATAPKDQAGSKSQEMPQPESIIQQSQPAPKSQTGLMLNQHSQQLSNTTQQPQQQQQQAQLPPQQQSAVQRSLPVRIPEQPPMNQPVNIQPGVVVGSSGQQMPQMIQQRGMPPVQQYPPNYRPSQQPIASQQYPGGQGQQAHGNTNSSYPNGQMVNQYMGYSYQMRQEQQHKQQMNYFDKMIRMQANILKTDKKEIAGIQVEMPFAINQSIDYYSSNAISKAEYLKTYEPFIRDAKPEEKVQFLEKTILNRAALKRSLMRNKNGIFKSKKHQKKTITSKPHTKGSPLNLKCPVFKCFKLMKDEAHLLSHFNEQHEDLKKLGLDLAMGVTPNQLNLGGDNPPIKGKVSNNLLNQLLLFVFANQESVNEQLKELNDTIEE